MSQRSSISLETPECKKIIEFVRKKDFQLLQELGRGGFGRTVLLYDSAINENFVCKKYELFHKEHKEEFYKNFVQEIEFLYTVNHPYIVRVFSYYLYPELHTGYILMEYVKGKQIILVAEKAPSSPASPDLLPRGEKE